MVGLAPRVVGVCVCKCERASQGTEQEVACAGGVCVCTLEGACVTEKGFGSDGCNGEGAGVPRVGCHGEVWGGGERGGSNASHVDGFTGV